MRSRRNSDGPWTIKVPKREKDEVLAAFAAHKGEVTAGYVATATRG
jgi:hemoglobin